MKNKDKIAIANETSTCFQTLQEYSRYIFTCDIILKQFFANELLAKYSCQYMLKTINDVNSIEHPQYDISETLEVVAPSCWSISSVTEYTTAHSKELQYKKIPIITATFNIYKQLHTIGNKRFCDTKTAYILS